MADWEDAPGSWEDAPTRRTPPTKLKPKSFGEEVSDRVAATPMESFAGPAVRQADTGLALASGVVAPPIAGLAGIAQGVKNIFSPGMPAADRVRQVEEALTYQPRTEMGQAVTGALSYPFVKLSELGEFAGGKVADTGRPALGAAVNTAIQAAPIALGELGRFGAARMKSPTLTPEQVALQKNVATARARGIQLTPTQAELGAVKKTLEGLTGSTKMEKLASIRNQPIVNSIIKEDLGIPENVRPTRDVLASMRKQEGANYEAIRGSGNIKADTQFTAAINDIEAPYKRVAQDFPKTKPPAILGELEALKEPTFSASSAVDKIGELRDKADLAYRQGDKTLGRALKNAANAMEDQIGRHLERTKAFQPPGLLENFRASRANIARLYTAEKALNDATGNFSAQTFARELKKGKPLTGGQREVGELGQAFSGSLRDVDAMRDKTEFGFGDLFLGGLGHMIAGNWPALATVAARPAIRHAMLAPTGGAVSLSDLAKGATSARPLIPLSTLGQRQDDAGR